MRNNFSGAITNIHKSITLPGKKNPSGKGLLRDSLKRLFDIAVSLVALIVLSPFFGLIIWAIKRDTTGPAFFQGARTGKNGKEFKILKFRTMYETPESYAGPKVTANDDPRVTPLGRWLRETKLNELPQLWNVLMGEMSMVGPRPEDPEIANQWPEEIRKVLLSVRPGITSPASVQYRHEENLLQSKSMMDQYLLEILPSKLRLDYLYVRNHALLTDLDVIFWTFVVLLPRLNKFSVPEALLYWGPFSRFTARYFVWFLLDLIVAFFSVGMAGVIWRMDSPLDIGWDRAPLLALGIAVLFSLVNWILGLNSVDWTKNSGDGGMDLAASSTIVTLILFIFNYLWPKGPLLPHAMLLVIGMLSFFGFVFTRYRSRVLTAVASRWLNLRTDSMSNLGERVLIIGAGELGTFAKLLLQKGTLASAFNIVGYVDDDPRRLGMQIDGIRVLGTCDDIPTLSERYDVGLIMFAIGNIRPEEEERILSKCRSKEVRLIQMPDMLDSMRAYFPAGDRERDEMFSRVLENATLDKLTGVYNQNHFLKLASQEIPRSRRYKHALSLAIIEIESNHHANALQAPTVAAQVLKEVANRCKKNIPEIDLLSRYDEFQFALLLPETEITFARLVCERLVRQISELPVETDSGPLCVSVRYGLWMDSTDNGDVQLLIEKARQDMLWKNF
jgi:diguanylate cyclase (GGDEF)-like protein